MKSFKEQQGIEEAPLVMNDMDMIETLFKKIREDMSKDKRKNKGEANWPKMQALAKLAGYGISKANQAKDKSFRYDLKK
jgi:hypothetical protein|tara:strand:- start:71 stop:307 length:237 start_codon:yes stop_codon:yes gene_type:complete